MRNNKQVATLRKQHTIPQGKNYNCYYTYILAIESEVMTVRSSLRKHILESLIINSSNLELNEPVGQGIVSVIVKAQK